MSLTLLFISSPISQLFLWMQHGKLTFVQHCLSELGIISSISIAVCLELVLPNSPHVTLHVNQLPIQIAFSLPSHLSPAAPCCQLLSSLQISHKPCWKLSWKCSESNVSFAVCCSSTDSSWFLPCRTQSCSLEEEHSQESPRMIRLLRSYSGLLPIMAFAAILCSLLSFLSFTEPGKHSLSPGD